jgi:glycosyltransferase involved in cell wall biosynthesis
VIVNLVYPSSRFRAGGVTMLYEFANVLARRGHEVHFLHGPAVGDRVDRLEDLPFTFDPLVHHHLVDSLDDPALPAGDAIFGVGPARLGQPLNFIQGFRLVSPSWDHDAFRRRVPKVCVATWLVDVGRCYGVPDEQLFHVPMGLDHDLFAARTGPTDRPVDVAMLYHPWPAKGWDVGRAVLDALVRRRPGLRAIVFSLAGAPPEPLPEGVTLALDLDQRSLADQVLNASKLLVQTSHHEGFGLTAIEAMACGAALVTTDCGGSRDYAHDGETALVRPAGDVPGLVDACDALLTDTARRTALAAAGERYVRRFDWERSGELLEDLLERYVADPKRYQGPLGPDRSEEFTL